MHHILYLSFASTNVIMLPEKIAPPIPMAGPANRWAANRGWRDTRRRASPLKISRPGYKVSEHPVVTLLALCLAWIFVIATT